MKYIITFVLSLMAMSLSYSEEKQYVDLLKNSEQAYAAGNYDSSLVFLKKLSDQGYKSFSLYYNMGNAYYKSGNIPEAILYYEKAKRLRPNEDDLNYNLQLANAQITDNVKELPDNRLIKFIAGALQTDTWAILSVAAFFLFLIGLFLFFYLPSARLKSMLLSSAIASLLIASILYLLAVQRKTKLDNKLEAVIMAPTVTVTSAPSETGKKLFVIHEGLKVEILEEQGTFAKIKLADGNVGWTSKNIMEVI